MRDASSRQSKTTKYFEWMDDEIYKIEKQYPHLYE